MTFVRGFLVSIFLIISIPVSAAETLRIVSFSTVLTEIAREVGGEHVDVAGLVKPGQDPHEYQPTPSDLKQAADCCYRAKIWSTTWTKFGKRPVVRRIRSRWAMPCRR
jgi:hypothetical protein